MIDSSESSEDYYYGPELPEKRLEREKREEYSPDEPEFPYYRSWPNKLKKKTKEELERDTSPTDPITPIYKKVTNKVGEDYLIEITFHYPCSKAGAFIVNLMADNDFLYSESSV